MMGTIIRAEISKSNPYWLEKHRYYELKHFCLQYHSWKDTYRSVSGYRNSPFDTTIFAKMNGASDPTADYAIKRVFYSDRIEMLQRAARMTEPVLGDYILQAVTNGWSYDILRARMEIPCCKSTYYDLYRRFFWILSAERK